MTDLSVPMTVAEYLDWAEKQPRKRFELWNGRPLAAPPQTVLHVKTKLAVATAFVAAAKQATTPCHVLPSGMAIQIDEWTAYEPDAQVYCGTELPGDAMLVMEPVVVVQIALPGTVNIDTGVKLEGYFSLPSVIHYLIIEPERRVITHHARREKIETTIIREGEVRLDPPGLVFPASEAFAY